MKKVLLAFMALFMTATVSMANSYTVDDVAVDALMDNAVEMSYDQVDMNAADLAVMDIAGTKEKSAIVATVLAWFFGGLGVHRWYLGSSIGTYIVYCFIGGCLGYIDFWILLISGLIKGNGTSQYENNDSLLMWK